VTIRYDRAKKERFIPVTFDELVEETAQVGIVDRDQCNRFAALLRAHYHQEFHARMLETTNCYRLFNPDRDTIMRKHHSEEERQAIEKSFLDRIIPLLEDANYEELNEQEINDAITATSPYGVEVRVDFSKLEHVRLFFRGSALKEEKRRQLRTLFLKKERVETKIYRRLFLLFKQEHEGRELIHLKLFKDIPKSDLEMLFPNIRVKIALFDKVKLLITGGGGTVAGTMSLLGKLAAGLEPMALLSAVGAFGAVIGKQIVSVFNHRTKYMAKLAQNLYFYNLGNNSGVLSHLFDAAEDEEVKEAFLAYIFLLQQGECVSRTALDRAIESFMEKTFAIPMDFEIDDALEKLIDLELIDLELIEAQGEQIKAYPIDEVLEILEKARVSDMVTIQSANLSKAQTHSANACFAQRKALRD
jgi:hypothetical protein